MKRLAVVLTASALTATLLAACASAGSSPLVTPSSSSPDGETGASHSEFGQPGDPAAIDRSLDIQLLDALTFDPPTVTVAQGQTIEFRITNAGATDHEFVLGDEATQQEHEAEMGGGSASMHMPADEPNLLAVAPGETATLVWTFTEPGTVLYGCHLPGHYAAGMVGTITVTAG